MIFRSLSAFLQLRAGSFKKSWIEAEINSGGKYLVFTTAGPSDVDGWVDLLTTNPEVVASEAPGFRSVDSRPRL